MACLLTGFLLLSPTSAFAEHTYLSQIANISGETGVDAVAVDPADNDVWVVPGAGESISEYGAYPSLTKIHEITQAEVFELPFFEGGYEHYFVKLAVSGSTGDPYLSANGPPGTFRFNNAGEYLERWAPIGNGGDYIAVDDSAGLSAGRVYLTQGNVTAWEGDHVEVPFEFSPPGNPGEYDYITANEITGTPSGPAEFSATAVNQQGDIYARTGTEVAEFKPSGEFILAFSLSGAPGGFSARSNEFMASDPTDGNVLVTAENAVDEFSSTGEYLDQIPQMGRGPIAVNSEGYVYAGPVYEGSGSGSETFTHYLDIYAPYVSFPAVSYRPPSSIAPTALTVSGHIGPAEGPKVTACHFEYGPTETYGAELPCLGTVGEEVGTPANPIEAPTDVHADLTGLQAETTYHYRLLAANSNGTEKGEDQTVETAPAVAEVTTGPPEDVEKGSATLTGSYKGEGKDTQYYFEYVESSKYEKAVEEHAANPYSEGMTTATPPGLDNGTATGTQQLSAPIEGLRGGTTYHYRFVAHDEYGYALGRDETLTTHLAVGGVETVPPATEITNVSAALHGSLTGGEEGLADEYYFEYGTSTSYGLKSSPATLPATATGTQEVSLPIGTGTEKPLEPGTTYHYRLVAENKYGPTRATNDETFTTFQAPTIEGISSSHVTSATANLDARINPQGFATKYHFQYGTTTAYGQSTPVVEITAGLSEGHSVEVPVNGIQGVTYHFRLIAENKWDEGTPTTSEDQSFEFFPPTCPNAAVRQQTSANYLPDCRAYELVSPENANGTLLYPGGPNTGYATSPSRFAFVGAYSSIAGANVIDTHGDLYIASRTDTGWVSHYVGLAGNEAGCMGVPPNEVWSHADFLPSKSQEGVIADPSLDRVLDWNDGNPIACAVGGNGTGDADFGLDPASNAGYLWNAEGALQQRLPTDLPAVPGAAEALTCPNHGDQQVVPLCSGDSAASADLSHFVFSSTRLSFSEPGAPEEEGLTEPPGSAYDNDLATGKVKLISTLADGEPIRQGPEDIGNTEEFIRFPAVSSDGSHVLMSTKQFAENGGAEDEFGHQPFCAHGGFEICERILERRSRLYMSIDDSAAYEVSEDELTHEEVGVKYVGMTSDGSHVYFTSEEHLTAEDPDHGGAGLYMWSAEKAEKGEKPLTLISKGDNEGNPGEPGNTEDCTPAIGEVQKLNGGKFEEEEAPWTKKCGVTTFSAWAYAQLPGGRGGNGYSDAPIASENGDIYFFSPEQLDGTKGVPGQENLYDYREGRAQYVTTLTTKDHCTRLTGEEPICASGPIARLEVTPHDSHMAFLTDSQLTSYNNAGHLEMYSYTPGAGEATGSLVCDSCNPSGQPATVNVEASQDGLFLTEGGRVFFSTSESLVPRDTNDATDVYEFVDGRPQLISSGTGVAPPSNPSSGEANVYAWDINPGLVSVSANGTDAYFSTYDTLVSQDHNGNFLKFYDARTDGGFPIPPPGPPCEAAEECHGSGTEAPVLPTQGTAATLAGGNATPGKKQATKPKKHHKKRKRAKHIRHHTRAAHHDRRAGR